MLLEANQLGFMRQEKWILRGLSFVVGGGEALYIAGDNGSGKTTLLRLLAGFLAPSEGEINGLQDATIKYVGHESGLYPDLTVQENLEWMGLMTSKTPSLANSLQELRLANLQQRLVQTLSAGQKRRLALLRLWLGDSKLWLLDEPFTALDETSRHLLLMRFKEHLSKGGILVFTSHQSAANQDQLPYQTVVL